MAGGAAASVRAMPDPFVMSRRQRRRLRLQQRADRRKFDGVLYSAWTPVDPPPAARLDPPGELAPADELVPSEPLAATLYLDGARQPAIPEVVRAAHGDLTLASVRAAVARLEADRVPPNRDGTYHVHVTSVVAALARAAWRLVHLRTWAAARRAVARAWSGAGPRDDLAAVAARATDNERAQALQRIRREVWKPVARRRRQDRKARRGWA